MDEALHERAGRTGAVVVLKNKGGGKWLRRIEEKGKNVASRAGVSGKFDDHSSGERRSWYYLYVRVSSLWIPSGIEDIKSPRCCPTYHQENLHTCQTDLSQPCIGYLQDPRPSVRQRTAPAGALGCGWIGRKQVNKQTQSISVCSKSCSTLVTDCTRAVRCARILCSSIVRVLACMCGEMHGDAHATICS